MLLSAESRRGRCGGLLCVLIAASLAVSACNGPSGGTTADASKQTDGTAAAPISEVEGVLRRMLKAYREAKSYGDRGHVVFRIHGAKGDVEEKLDCRVEFERPNRLRLEFQHALPAALSGREPPHVLVVADGKQIFAAPEGYDAQVVVVDDPQRVTVPELYNLRGLGPLFPLGITGQSAVLDLLTGDKPMQELDRRSARLLKPDDIEGRSCDRVQFDSKGGPLTFWIDQKTSVLRRVEYPTGELLTALKQQGVTGIEVATELAGAALDGPPAEGRFTWAVSAEEHYVRELVQPPDPEHAPPKALGQPAPEFPFVNAAGEKRDVKSLFGKVTVIDFWATWCGWCIKGMPGVEQVRKNYAGNDKVQFLALSVDTPDVGNDQIAAVLREIKVETPWARSSLADADELYALYHFDGIPAMVILGPDGRVQYHHVGMDANITKTLPPLIDALLAGEDVSKKSTAPWEAEQREYRRKIALARVDVRTTTIEIPRAKIAERSEPGTFRLRPLWTAAEVKGPGNILVVEQAGAPPRVLVIDQWHEIVELGPDGKQLSRHKDLVSGQPAFSFLRTAVDRQGQRLWLAGAVGQPQFHLFDAQWKRLLSYPEAGSAQIFDVLPADLDGDGQPELCVGYFGPVGVHGVSLDGRRLWRNRTIENVADLAVTAPDASKKRRLLCVHDGGTVMPIRPDGQADPPIRFLDHAITHVLSADLGGDGKLAYCGIASDASGNRAVVGLAVSDQGGEVTWQHDLPSGEHERPIDVLTTAHLVPGQPGQWLVAAADGSVHIVSHDGASRDRFNSGAVLTGLASATLQGKPALLLAHPDRLEAFAVEKNPEKKP